MMSKGLLVLPYPRPFELDKSFFRLALGVVEKELCLFVRPI